MLAPDLTQHTTFVQQNSASWSTVPFILLICLHRVLGLDCALPVPAPTDILKTDVSGLALHVYHHWRLRDHYKTPLQTTFSYSYPGQHSTQLLITLSYIITSYEQTSPSPAIVLTAILPLVFPFNGNTPLHLPVTPLIKQPIISNYTNNTIFHRLPSNPVTDLVTNLTPYTRS